MPYLEHAFSNLPHHLTGQEMQNPHLVIKDFFSCYDLPFAILQLENWVRSAFAEKSRLSKSDSLLLLDIQEHLIRLLEAALLLDDESSSEGKTMDVQTAPDSTLLNTALFYTPHPTTQAWDCFPRHLSRTEYRNPYHVFTICLGQLDLAGWRKFLKGLFYAATYDTPISGAINDDDIQYTCKCLYKLLEACHLIKVREIDSNIAQEPIPAAPNGPRPSATALHAVYN
jgi:hypothetical protein